jgi:hypothetical protein
MKHLSHHQRHAREEEATLRELRLQLALEERALNRNGEGEAMASVPEARRAVESAIMAVREGDNRRALQKLREARERLAPVQYPAVVATREDLEAALDRWEPVRP